MSQSKKSWQVRKIHSLLTDWYGSEFAAVEITAYQPQPRLVGDLLDAVMAKAVGPNTALIAQLRERWSEVVGSQLAKHSQFVRFEGDQAIIEVNHPAWLVELNRMKKLLLAKLNTAIGENRCTELRFIPAGRS